MPGVLLARPSTTRLHELKISRTEVSVRKTIDTDVYSGGVYGQLPLDLSPIFPGSFVELGRVWDQFRLDKIVIHFQFIANPEYNPVIMAGVAFDPDGYTTNSGRLLEHSNLSRFTLSATQQSPEYPLVPGFVETDGEVKHGRWFDIALANQIPTHHLGGLFMFAYQMGADSETVDEFEMDPPNVTHFAVQVSTTYFATFRGAR